MFINPGDRAGKGRIKEAWEVVRRVRSTPGVTSTSIEFANALRPGFDYQIRGIAHKFSSPAMQWGVQFGRGTAPTWDTAANYAYGYLALHTNVRVANTGTSALISGGAFGKWGFVIDILGDMGAGDAWIGIRTWAPEDGTVGSGQYRQTVPDITSVRLISAIPCDTYDATLYGLKRSS